MTDKEAFIALLNRFEIPYLNHDDEHIYIGSYDEYDFNTSTHTSIPSSDKVKGYGGFYAHWKFDNEGKFVDMGVWE